MTRVLAGAVALISVGLLNSHDPPIFQGAMIAAAIVCSLHAARDPYAPKEPQL